MVNSGVPTNATEYKYASFELECGDEHEEETISTNLNPNNTDVDSPSSALSSSVKVDRDIQRKWTILLYATTTILLFADQNLLAPNLSAAADEFGFNDMERDEKLGGHIALAFFIIGAPASFVVGCMADSENSIISRNVLYGIIVLIGEGACIATFFSTTYHGLYITRAFTGLSVGGALPLLSSVLADLYPPHQRTAVMSYVGVGTGLGTALGQGVSGFVGPMYNSWRLPFLIIGLPAIVAALLIITTVTDPESGGQERKKLQLEREVTQQAQRCSSGGSGEESGDEVASEQGLEMNTPDILQESLLAEKSSLSDVQKDNQHQQFTERKYFFDRFVIMFKPSTYTQHIRTTKELLQTKSVIFALLQGAPGCIPWGIINTFLNDYLSEDCGMTVQAATFTILIFGVGCFIGMISSGIAGDYLYRKDRRYPSLLSGTMAILGCVPLWFLINITHIEATDDNQGEKVVVPLWMLIRTSFFAFFAGVGSSMTGPIVKATLQNVTLPNTRGQAFALLNTFDDFGRGLGPLFVAMLIRDFGGRRPAFNIGVAAWILCGIFNLSLFFTVKVDEERAQRLFAERHDSTIGDCGDNKIL